MILKSSQEIIKKRILYSEAVFGNEERLAVLESLQNQWLASGPLVQKFEKQVAKRFGKKYGIAVNSGSSANLLAIASLELEPGSEVITPACTFATTVSTIIQNGLTPVFVDSVIGRYTIDEDLVEKAVTKKTKLILVPQLIGGVCDMTKLQKIAKKHGLVLFDDSCDTFAPKLKGKTVASYSKLTTTSFYGSHIITACGVGGMIMTDDEKLRDTILIHRDWGRAGNDKEDFEKRFDFAIDGKIPYDAKFLYTKLGYNVKMNEASAAFGLVQLKKLPKFTKTRNRNFKELIEFFSDYKDWFHLPYLIPGAVTNWLAFPLTIKADAPFNRYEFLKFLEKKNIQTRVIFSGNITRHPVYEDIKFKTVGSLKNSDEIMAQGLLLGCHHGMTKADVRYIKRVCREFFSLFQKNVTLPKPKAYELKHISQPKSFTS